MEPKDCGVEKSDNEDEEECKIPLYGYLPTGGKYQSRSVAPREVTRYVLQP